MMSGALGTMPCSFGPEVDDARSRWGAWSRGREDQGGYWLAAPDDVITTAEPPVEAIVTELGGTWNDARPFVVSIR